MNHISGKSLQWQLSCIVLVGLLYSSTVFAQQIRLDVDASNAPASETQTGFTRMTDPAISGDSINGFFAPTATVSGVTVTAVETVGTGAFRDRMIDSPTVPPQPYQNLLRDFIGGASVPGATIEVTIQGLPFGYHQITSFHHDWCKVGFLETEFSIFVDDANGTNQLQVADATFDNSGPDTGQKYVVRSNGVNDVVLRFVENSVDDFVRFNGIIIEPIPTIVRFDVDAFDAPGSGPNSELQFPFTRMTEPGMLGNASNGAFSPSAGTNGIVATATLIGGDLPQFRDREIISGTNPPQPYQRLLRDFIGNVGENSEIELTIFNLPARDFLINTFHYDSNFNLLDNSFDIFVDDANGNNQLLVNNGNYSDTATYFGEFFKVSSNGTDEVVAQIIEDISSDGFGIRFNGVQIIPLADTVDVCGAGRTETRTNTLLPDEPVIFELDYDGIAAFTIDAMSTLGAETIELALYDANGILLDDSSGFPLAFSNLDAGTYYVAATSFGSEFSDGFAIEANDTFVGPFEINFTSGNTPSVRGTFNQSGFSFSDNDTFGYFPGSIEFYEVNYDGSSALSLNTFGSNIDTELGLYDASGNIIAVNDDIPGTTQSLLTLTDLPAGTYYLAISAFNAFFQGDFKVTTNSTAIGNVDVNVLTAASNDNFFGPNLSGFPFFESGNNFGATTEPGEQNLEETDHTVWWFFNAPEDGTVTINTFGSDFDTQLHVYEGFMNGSTPADLTLVTSNNDTGGLQSSVTFSVEGGECYDVRVGAFVETISFPLNQGTIELNGTFTPDIVLGDVNCDGVVNLLDVQPFVDAIANGEFNNKADINQDGAVNLLDVEPFINILSGG